MHSFRMQPLVLLLLLLFAFLLGLLTGHVTYPTIASHLFKVRFAAEEQETRNFYKDNFLGVQAPAFEAVTNNGKKWNLSDHKDKVIVLHFWSTSCNYCLKQIPALVELNSLYSSRKDVVFTGVCLDLDKNLFPCYINAAGMTWPHLYEHKAGWENSIVQQLEINSIPSLWVIDQKGIIRGAHIPLQEVSTLLKSLTN